MPVIASGGAGELEHLARGAARGRGRRAVRVDLPLRPPHDRRGQGAPGRGGDTRARRLRPHAGGRECRRGRSSVDDPRRRAPRMAAVIERLRELPGGPELLELARGRDDVELVGGAVRDLLLGGTAARAGRRSSRVTRPDSPVQLAAALSRSDGSVRTCRRRMFHERFGTATVDWPQRAHRHRRAPQPSATPRRGPCRRSARARSRRICAAATSRSTRSRVPLGGDRERAELHSRRRRARRPRRGTPARAARAELPRRPDAPAAPRALPRAPGLRARASRRLRLASEAIAAGALDTRLAGARSAPSCAWRSPSPIRWLRWSRCSSSACSRRCTRRSSSTHRSRVQRWPRCPSPGGLAGRPAARLAAAPRAPLRHDRLRDAPARAARRLGVPGGRARADRAQRDPRTAHRRAPANRARVICRSTGGAPRAARGYCTGRGHRRALPGRVKPPPPPGGGSRSCATSNCRSTGTT